MRTRAIPALLASVFMLCACQSALAAEVVQTFSVTPSTTQAGGHPDLEVSVELESPGQTEAARNLVVEMPKGFFGNPNAIGQCSSVEFALYECPPSSQAGIITVYANYKGDPNRLLGTVPIFDREPTGDETALFAFVAPILDVPVSIPVHVRTGTDYGLRFTVAELTQLAPLSAADMTYWGFPADESHDAQRFRTGHPGEPPGCPSEPDTSCNGAPVPAAISVHPLTDNPTSCSGAAQTVALEVQTYQDPEHPTPAQAPYPATTGCQNMTFTPVLYAQPTTSAADSPSGLDLRLSAPQPLGKASTPSSIRSATLTLPDGFTINPDAADGQSACTDAQAGFGSEAPSACTDNAKIGTFEIDSPSLDGSLTGSIYIGEPVAGRQYRLFLIADGFGIHAKFLADLVPDPTTGQVTAVIDDLPEVPFEEFRLHLFASDRGLMATPTRCGIYEVAAHFLPWNSALADVTSQQFFTIRSGPEGDFCPELPRPFQPRLVAGTANPTAGAFSDFTLKLDRDDGDQYLGDLGFTLPPGFTGSLRGLTYCPEAAIAAAAQRPGRAEQTSPSCPASSMVGTTNVAAGPGTHPFHVVGKMYLAGPLKGAPISLAAITPAVAGPYDYGTQVVRVALDVDPLTAQVTALSDTVPTIIGGIPLRMRSIQVSINRPNFTINPTNCEPMSVSSKGIGDQGTVAEFSSYFHVVNCRALKFKPTMTVKQLGGRKSTRRGADPALRFDLRTRAGDANIKSLTVTLPNAFSIDQEHLGNLCTEKELVETDCEGRQAIGVASTTTPLLDAPLSGQAYAVSGSGGLPRLAFVLDGQVSVRPRAETKTDRHQRLVTTVPVVPDVPIGHFRFDLYGGKRGYLDNTRGLCAHPPRVTISYVAQNGKTRREQVQVMSPCKGKSHGHSA